MKPNDMARYLFWLLANRRRLTRDALRYATICLTCGEVETVSLTGAP